ncbi:MAG TPA: O-antigen ligase family protein [Pyrinomonadaceae bacterium]|nr:O-antigen ligase family protein [Pyrinomonadaceae bacterium]
MITPIPYGTVEPWWKAAFVCAVFGIFILGIWQSEILKNPSPVLLPLLALSVLAFLQSWTRLSVDPFQTRFFALQLLSLTAFLALLYRYAATEERLRVLVYTIVGVAILSAIFGILRQTTQYQTGFLLPLLKQNQGFAQFINKNHFAYLMEMALGLLIGLIIAGGSKQKLIQFALLLPIWIALVLSNSRGGILAMLAQVTLVSLFLLRTTTLKLALAVVLVAGVLLGTIWVGGERLVTNFSAAGNELTPTASDGASRNEIWRASLKMFAAHPLLGVGLGAYWISITAYHDASGVLTPQEAHDDYLELLSSGGVVGLALGLWFVVTVVRVARRNLNTDTGFIRAVRIGAVLGLAGVAAHSLLDFGLHLFGNTVVFFTLIMLATFQRKAHIDEFETT